MKYTVSWNEDLTRVLLRYFITSYWEFHLETQDMTGISEIVRWYLQFELNPIQSTLKTFRFSLGIEKVRFAFQVTGGTFYTVIISSYLAAACQS